MGRNIGKSLMNFFCRMEKSFFYFHDEPFWISILKENLQYLQILFAKMGVEKQKVSSLRENWPLLSKMTRKDDATPVGRYRVGNYRVQKLLKS